MNSFITHDNGHIGLFGTGAGNPNFYTESVLLNDTGTLYYQITDNYGFGTLDTGVTSAVSAGTWNYVVGTNDGTNLKIYLNGSLAASVSSAGDSIASNPFAINSVYPQQAGNVQLDEVRAGNATLSAAWIATEYNNQSSPSTFYTAGGQQTPSQVSSPTFSPAPGTYTSAQTVTISATTSGASIRYTLDGTTPSETAGSQYSGPITVGNTITFKAIAYKSGLTDSTVNSASYTINAGSPGWYSTGGTWQYREPITISHGQVSASLTTSPYCIP